MWIERLVGLEVHDRAEVKKQLVDKVEREINRIELQSGLDQVKRYRSQDEGQGNEHFEYFTADFIRRLIHSVVDICRAPARRCNSWKPNSPNATRATSASAIRAMCLSRT